MLSNLAFIVTTRCNLHCAHCLRGYYDQHHDLPLDLAAEILTSAKPFGASHVGMTGGEPYLHPQFDALVALIVESGYTWSFTSNGLRSQPYIGAMTRHRENFTHVTLSLEGASPETHARTRHRPDAYERVLINARHYIKTGFKVQIGFTLHRHNKHELDEIAQLAVDLKGSKLAVAAIIPTEWNNDLWLTDEERFELYTEVMVLRSKLDIDIGYASALHTRGGVDFCDNLHLHKLAFNARGELIFCCDTINQGAVIGSLQHTSFPDLIQTWLSHSASLQQHRTELIAQGKETIPGFDSCAFCNSHFDISDFSVQ
jgi:MoaA/NifB/PqqE/SkfB family radical SAM enzyme